MLLGVFNVKIIGAVLLTGITIKLIDDYLDSDNSVFRTIIESMGRGILPYSILIFSISCMLNTEVSVSLLASAYIVGMLSDLNRRLTFGLRGYQESIITIVIFIFLLGLREMIVSLLIIFITQLIDDIIDIKKDSYYNNKNLAIKYGLGEVTILSMILILIVFKLSPFKLIICLMVFSLIEFIESHIRLEDEEWI